DGVVLAGQRRHLELAADAVGAGDQDRVAVVAGEQARVEVEAEQAGETAKTVEDARCVRAAQQRHHAGEALLVDVEVEAGRLVGQRRARLGRRGGHDGTAPAASGASGELCNSTKCVPAARLLTAVETAGSWRAVRAAGTIGPSTPFAPGCPVSLP